MFRKWGMAVVYNKQLAVTLGPIGKSLKPQTYASAILNLNMSLRAPQGAKQSPRQNWGIVAPRRHAPSQ